MSTEEEDRAEPTQEANTDPLAKLLEHASDFRTLLDSITDATFVVDRNRRIAYWNANAELLTGMSASQAIGEDCLIAVRCEKCLQGCELFERGEVKDCKVEIIGREGPVLCTKDAFLLEDGNGQVIGGVEVIRDQTVVHQQLEDANRLNLAVLSSIREGVIAIDDDKRITSFSPRAVEITGYPATYAIGRKCSEIIGSHLCRSDCPANRCVVGESTERTSEIETASGKMVTIATVAAPLRHPADKPPGTVLVIDARSDRDILARLNDNWFAGMVGTSKVMRRLFSVIEQVAPTDATVLLTGESGTGKERAARAIHSLSERRHAPMQAINCAAMPETLLDSEMFGHARGAFTGAIRDRIGRVESAEGGTLFLDEVAEMSLALQAKLLRFVQEREYVRVGEERVRKANVRIVAATNRDLEAEVQAHRFREDLFYRLRVIPIELPPLRERIEDIPLLATHVVEELANRLGRPLRLTPGCLDHLCRHHWPGNIRELINALEYAGTLAPRESIRVADLPIDLRGGAHRPYRRKETEQSEAERIQSALALHSGNRSHAARALGMNRVTLYRKMRKIGLT